MKNPVLWACSAVMFYAIWNVLVEMKLSSFNPIAIFLPSYLVMLPVLLVVYASAPMASQKITLPTGPVLLLTAVMSFLLLGGDLSVGYAYRLGGTVMQVSTIVSAFPAAAGIAKFAMTGKIPTKGEIVGYVIVTIGVFVISRSSPS